MQWLTIRFVKSLVVFFIISTLLIVLSSCQLTQNVTEIKPKQTPIIVKIPYSYSDILLPEGDVGDDTFMTRYIYNQTGYKVQYSWEAGGEEQYSTKLDLALRSADLPDMFIVNRQQLKDLVEQDLITDLSSVYEQHASALVRSIYDATGGRALEEATFSDQLFGLPNVAILADGPTYVWIREDWLKQLKLTPPRTVYDIENIVISFIENDPDQNGIQDTVGIPVDRSLIYTNKTGIYGLNSIFSAFNAYPQNFFVNEEGHLVYGSIQAETKEALALLQSWYEKGIIDQHFLLRKDASLLVQQNQVGVIFAPWWAPFWPLASSVTMDTKAEWGVYQAPLDHQGRFTTITAPVTDRYLVVRKGYSNPEAAVVLLNLITKLERMVGDEDEETAELRSIAEQLDVQLRNYFPFDLLLDDPHGVIKRYEVLQQLQKGESVEEELELEIQQLYQHIKQENEHPKKDMEAWSNSNAYLLGGKVSTLPKTFIKSYNLEHISSFEEQYETLLKLEMDYFIGIITGERSIDSFDQFVEQWLEQGGIAILKEINGVYVE